MTHDELLAKIDGLDGSLIFHDGTTINAGKGDRLQIALRAVVELHKPSTYWKGKIVCSYCNIGGFRTVLYPCSTIEAIEKELS